MDLFFANDNGEYLEVTVNPDGRYYVALHASKTEPIAGDNTATKDEASSPILRLLRLDDVHSGEKCPLRDQEQCVWNTRVVIPRDYLPLDVTMFNAYATHGSGGEGAELLREALFTSANETTFHNLDNFGPISLWTELNYTENTEMSPLWSKALSDHQNFDSLVYVRFFFIVWQKSKPLFSFSSFSQANHRIRQ